VTVSVLLPLPGAAMLAGANFAVAPFGSPPTARLIADLNPFIALAFNVNVVALPLVTVALAGLAVNAKVGITTVTAIDAVRVSPPPMPVIVTVELPAAALAAALIVAVTGAAAVTVEEEKRTVTPVAMPLGVSVTGDVNPPCAVSVIVAAAELPAATEVLATFAVSVKFASLPSFQ
jgi:hypothetical protein